ncbi:low specificity L-threonine aldolase [Halobacterium salinarum]|uniref:threonine aldolase family protein n=1 Tax=Halobacterium salinarum TaxID=2242 RepID=UPI002556E548|nr:low specificity L-threonine aldolase [Halobacterium salinarum]MDL0127857.1 low specificity L-threonine aldolase [Halobacterium salinarum]MDL0145175.1 low specificity L-threonine aldolase [Halobacterium salinarum]
MIDLRSDTVATPTEAMREAAAQAPVEHGEHGDDPAVAAVEATAADAVGMAAAVFVPSRTMANQIGAQVHTARGQSVLVERASHSYRRGSGGLAQHAGVQARAFDGGETGCPTAEQVAAEITAGGGHRPEVGLACVEIAHGANGGVVAPVDAFAAAVETAHEHDVPVHVDGTRVFSAATALGVDAATLLSPVDSVAVCLSTGLGAPMGAVLAGSESFVASARRVQEMYGGGMQQAGMVAAAGVCALENRHRVHEDHENARRLAEDLDALPGVTAAEPDTNIVLVDTRDADVTAAAFLAGCEEEGVLGTADGEYTVRFCTHRDIGGADIAAVVSAAGEVV